jgi:hypothetical protein
LSWWEQVSRVVSRNFNLRLLYRFQRYTSRGLRIYLVRSLIISISLYTDVVYFPSLTGLEFRKLELVFNASTIYVFGLRRFDDISELSIGILGNTLFEYLELRLACFIRKIGLAGAPSYLSSLLVLHSSRHRFITVQRLAPSTSLRGDSFVYRGIRLWNVLPSACTGGVLTHSPTSSGSSTLSNNLIENTYFLFS